MIDNCGLKYYTQKNTARTTLDRIPGTPVNNGIDG